GSIRDWQRHTSQFAPGKNFIGTGGFGPWMVTTDEIPDISKQTIATRLNGVEVQAAPISDLVFDVPALIAYCSTFTELVPGDDIVTDGEIRRESYSNRFATALEGIDDENPAMITSRSGHQTPVPRVTGPVKRRGPVELHDMKFLRQNTDRAAKITLPGPFTMSQ